MKRIQHLDIAKGIGIILVVIGHSLIEWGHYLIYMFHMPLFFYLSGIFHKHDSFANVMTKKNNSLIVPFVIFSIILLIICSLFVDVVGGVSLVPPHLTGIVGPLWFLLSLYMVCILYNFLLQLKSVITLLICTIVTFLGGYIPDRLGWDNYLYLFSSFSLLIFYCIGHLWGRRIALKNKYQCMIAVAASITLFVLSYWISYKKMHLGIADLFDNVHPENFVMWILGSLTGILMVVSISLLIDGNHCAARWLAYLGESSLYIFAFHLAILSIMHHIIPEPIGGMEFLIIALAISTGCILRVLFNKLFPSVFK